MSIDGLDEEVVRDCLVEFSDIVSKMSEDLLELESNPSVDLWASIFRSAHNMKGTAAAVGMGELSHFTHKVEDVITKLRDGELPLTPDAISLLFKAVDVIEHYLEAMNNDLTSSLDSPDIVAMLESFLGGPGETSKEEESKDEGTLNFSMPEEEAAMMEEASTPAASDDSDLSAAALESLKELGIDTSELEANAAPTPKPTPAPVGEMPKPKLVVEPASPPPPAKPPAGNNGGSNSPDSGKRKSVDESLRVDINVLDRLINDIGETVMYTNMLSEHVSLLNTPKFEFLKEAIINTTKIVKELQYQSIELRMVAAKSLFQRAQRVVRDLSISQDKQINFEVKGDSLKLDKTIMESLIDPVIHIIRNAVDHGIESREERLANGKPEKSTVTMSLVVDSGQSVITISDDGKGINPEVILSKAIEKGIARAEQNYSDEQIFDFLFESGFSTKEQITDVSGRGVGMDVVKSAILALSGDVTIESKMGEGSNFIISLPLNLNVIGGIVCDIQGTRFVIPLAHLQETLDFTDAEIKETVRDGRALVVRGEIMPIVELSKVLNISSSTEKKGAGNYFGFICSDRTKKCVFEVDAFLGTQQILVKKLGAEHTGIRHLGGGAILGDGKPGIILDVPTILRKIA